MKAIKVKKIEGCLEGSNVWDILYDKEIGRDYVCAISAFGKLIFNEKMEKPYFKVISRGKFTIKGSVGNRTVRVILPESSGREALKEIEEIKIYGQQG